MIGAVVIVVGVATLWEDELTGWFGRTASDIAQFTKQHGQLGAALLLYAEESGVPLPMPGDVFVMYSGHRAGRDAVALLLTGAGLVLAVVLGATNLYLLARTLGRAALQGRLGAAIHVTPKTLARGERAFRRWGPLALIFGRHVPGFRIPITVAAGVLRVSYPLFAACIAVSSAVWVAIFMAVGLTIGNRVGEYARAHRHSYLFFIAFPVAVILAYVALRVVARVRSGRQAGGSVDPEGVRE